MYQLPHTLTEDLLYFGTLVDDFKQGRTSAAQFKANRVPMGIYEQREDGTYMIRVRCTGGFISPEQLRQVALSAREHASSFLHITTRQEIQIHRILIEETKTLLPELQEVSLSSKGGGGNTIRNILVDISSGIHPDETFDPLPYAVDLTSLLLTEPDSFNLPRKMKIAFSNRDSFKDFGVINDLGLVAKIQDGKRGFQVFLGGSVASTPTLGWEVFDFLPESELYNVAHAAKQFFNQHGNRKNKHKARMRYIFFKEGIEATKELFYGYYRTVKAEQDQPYVPKALVFEHKTPSFEPVDPGTVAYQVWSQRFAKPQRQEGLYSVNLSFPNGNAQSETFIRIADFAAEFGNDVLRFTTRQQLQVRNIPQAYLGNLYQLIRSLGLTDTDAQLISDVVSCTGADTCRLGICLSKGAATALQDRLRQSGLNLDEAAGFQINISGCPNSCAQQVWSDLGFSGRVIRNERMYPAYNVWGGADKATDTQIGEHLGVVSAKDLPSFSERVLADYLPVKQQYASFRAYLQAGGKEKVAAVLSTYKVPEYTEDPKYYQDWGSDEEFSVVNKGPAECSAGLFDMIDIDQKFIKQNFDKLDTEGADNNLLLSDIVFSSCRMLLITKGVEPRTTADTYTQFVERFIREGHISDEFVDLVESALIPKYDFTPRRAEVIALAKAVVALYDTMDDSLQFKTDKPVEKPAEAPKPAGQFYTKDLRGVSCPMNFVKTKIELSAIQSGDLLEVWLDDGQPIENVPGSVRNEGHQVLVATPVDGYWKVLIRKA